MHEWTGRRGVCRFLACGPQASNGGGRLVDIKMCTRVSEVAAVGRHGQATRPETPGALAAKRRERRMGAKATAHKSLLRFSWCNRDCAHRDGLAVHHAAVARGSDWRGLAECLITGKVVMSSAADGWVTSHTSEGFTSTQQSRATSVRIAILWMALPARAGPASAGASVECLLPLLQN